MTKMETNTKTRDNYGKLLAEAKRIDTTREGNGYPSGVKVAYTADTMGELRELWEAAVGAGHKAEAITLHRRDGWALWARMGSADLQDEAYMGQSDDDWTITIGNTSNCEEEAYQLICGTGYELEDVVDLFAKAMKVRELADELPDPDELEDGEEVKVFIDTNDWTINYMVKTGQNGYSYDTHQYCTALIITEKEEDED